MDRSQAHYNLIVYGSDETPIFRSPSGWDYFPSDRMPVSTDGSLKTKFSGDFSGLSEMPALVVAERQRGNNTQPAFVTRIDQIEMRGGNVHFRFEHLFDRITSEDVFDSGYFDIFIRNGGIDESRRTHWAVKNGNLMESVLRLLHHQPREQCPKAFDIEPWPLECLDYVAVMMPFVAEFDPVYEAVKSACSSLRLDTKRVDEIYGPTHIINDVFKTIEQSKMVVSDLTGRNPNVLYETGLAHARNRDVVMIVQNYEDVPFDLRHIRYVRYLPNQQGLEKLAADLTATISVIPAFDVPVTV